MKKYNLLALILLNAAIISCEDSKKNHFSFDETKFGEKFTNLETISLGLLNPDGKDVDSIVYYVNDKKVAAAKNLNPVFYSLKNGKLGDQELKAVVYYDGSTKGENVSGKFELVSDVQPKELKYTIVNTFDHDMTSFTEGLEFYRDTLFEGTGQYGISKLLKTDYKTGKILKSLDLQDQYFGEGITFINNKIYQLTYKEKTGFIYNADTWKLEKTFTFDKDMEGWGMTNDGKFIYQTDGSEKIWKMDPGTQKMVDYVNVYVASNKVKQVNELEYVDGKIYANIWQKDAIAVVDPATGAVEAVLNLSGLRKLVTNQEAEVLNGIAYRAASKTFFVTGKNWNKMFEIRVTE